MLTRHKSLKDLNTFGFEAMADVFFELHNEAELNSLWKTNLFSQNHPLVLGGGSNILFTQKYPGLVIKNLLPGKDIVNESSESVIVSLGAGENWHETVVWAVSQGWGGIENLSLIPGSVGAAPIQNIGAYGVELESAFHSLEAFDMITGKKTIFTHAQCQFGYRNSYFKNQGKGRYIITRVLLELRKYPELNIGYGDIKNTLESKGIQEPTIKDVSNAVIDIRQSKLPDPREIGNCGSFFKNPVIQNEHFLSLKSRFSEIKSFPAGEGFTKVPAAWLIEFCGWKGHKRGPIGVHQNQALVLVNYGGGSGKDVFKLAQEIQNSVMETFGVALEMEVNIL